MLDILNQVINAQNCLYEACAFRVGEFFPEKESAEYYAYSYVLEDKNIRFRIAKKTPTKLGWFVTLWKRSQDGPIQPYDSSNSFDMVIIRTQSENNSGQFVFPKQILIEKGIVTHLKKEGKRGFRIYPPWNLPTSKQAQKTQKWQLEFFLDIGPSQLNIERAKSLHHK